MTGQAAAQATSPVLGQAPDGDLASLKSQLGELRVQLAGLNVQWDGLKSQLDQMLRNNPARPGVQQQWADVGMQRASVEGRIASLEARIAQKQGLPVGRPVVPQFPRFYFVPNLIVPAVSVLTLVLAFPISVAWARRILRRAPRPTPVPSDVTMRLERIEQAVDTIAIEVERISEGQRFVTRLMAERPATGASADSVEKAGAQQPLMLGAGAMEPIVVAERERVRQRVVTPH
jgi:hypothetical protein